VPLYLAVEAQRGARYETIWVMDTGAAQTTVVSKPDGRRLRVVSAGGGERVVLGHLGSPNAGVLFEPWVRDAEQRGLRLVVYDRPGYGGSTPQPGRTVADCADDVRAIAAALGFDRCAVWGYSGGGPHALASAALLGGLVVAVATIGSPGPQVLMGDEFFAGTREGMRDDLALFDHDREAWDQSNQEQWEELTALSADQLSASWSETAAPADRAALASDFGVWMHRAVQEALAPGDEGWVEDDIAIFHASWGFDPADITVPSKIWHSSDDTFVPAGHGRWLAGRIPGAESEIGDDDGHMRIMAKRYGDVQDWLAAHL
jgi:pimeloyl-ACP methyl ester carboxylesterase